MERQLENLDCRQFSYSLEIANLSREGKAVCGARPIFIAELARQSLVLELPDDSCAPGDRLAISILPCSWKIVAKVIDASAVDAVADSRMLRVVLEVEPPTLKTWRNFRARLRWMQVRIDGLFKRMRR